MTESRQALLLAVLFAVLAFASGSFVSGAESTIDTFADLPVASAPDEDAGRALMERVAARLKGEQLPNLPSELADDVERRIVFLSLGREEVSARVVRGAGRGITAAVDDAAAKLVMPDGADLDSMRVKLDVVLEAFAVEVDAEQGFPRHDRSIYGLALEGAVRVALLPEQLMSYGAMDLEGRAVLGRLAVRLEKGQTDPQELKDLLLSPDVRAYRFTTQAFFRDGADIVSLYRGHRMFQEVDPTLLLSAVERAGRYLARSIDADGRFAYSYWPGLDYDAPHYGIVRHAGTLYSMFEIYEVTRDPELLEAGKRALGFLLDAVKEGRAVDQRVACVVEDGYVKLGANALGAVAIAKYIETTGDRSYLPLLRRLGEWIRFTQTVDGQFAIHKQKWPGGHAAPFESAYYPGEALLAMVRIYRLDPDPRWLDTAERGAHWLITVRDADVPTSELNHDHWLLYALNEIHRRRPDPLYLEHTRRITRAIVQSQNRDPEWPDWLGSYYKPPRSTPTATRTEGLCAAFELLRDFGSEHEAEEVLDAVKLGVRFQLQTQFRPESVMYLSDPHRSLGAFHRSLTNFEIRIDYVQHNVSGMLALRRILLSRP